MVGECENVWGMCVAASVYCQWASSATRHAPLSDNDPSYEPPKPVSVFFPSVSPFPCYHSLSRYNPKTCPVYNFFRRPLRLSSITLFLSSFPWAISLHDLQTPSGRGHEPSRTPSHPATPTGAVQHLISQSL